MSTFMYMLTKNQGKHGLLARIADRFSRCSEIFWLTTSLLLFMLLGPFSAVIVVIALFNLAGQGHVKAMKEPASCVDAKG